MSQVIVITSGKGGVGKTTTTANIGVGLASLGNKVVLIDTDIGLRNLDIALGMEERIVYDLVDVANGQCTPEQAAIQDKRFDGLYLIPAAQTSKAVLTPQQMQELCEKLKKDFDYVVIDCPAGIEQGFKNAISGADVALVVTIPEIPAIRDADRIIGLLEANEIPEHYLVINRLRPDMIHHGDMMNVDEMMEILDINLMGIVPDSSDIIIATNKGEPVVLNPKSIAGQAFRNICQRLNGDNVPLMEFEKDTLIKRIKKFFNKK